MLNKAINFVKKDMWRIHNEDLSKRESQLLTVARVIALAAHKFENDRCADKASALTYYLVLAIVPLAAMAFGIANAFGFGDVLMASMRTSLEGQEVIADYLIEFADKYLSSMKNGLLASVSLAMLIWSVMKLIGRAESAFNQIWETKKSRSIARKFSDYISIVLIAVIAIAAYSGFMIEASGHFTNDLMLKKVWQIVITVTPCLLVCIGLSLVYFILPVTKVNFGPALLGGTIAGIGLIATQFIYLYFQIGISKNNAIYGSFAAIPLFLVWVQTMWYIVMLGCEIAFAAQNYHTRSLDSDTSKYSISLRRKIALYITACIVKEFENKQKAPTAAEISVKLKLPLLLVVNILGELTECGLISEVQLRDEKKHEGAYQPAFDINIMTIYSFINMTEDKGEIDMSEKTKTADFQRIADVADKIIASQDSEIGSKLIKDL